MACLVAPERSAAASLTTSARDGCVRYGNLLQNAIDARPPPHVAATHLGNRG